MKVNFREVKRTAPKLNFIWGGILFSAFYWILESIRDVIAFNKGLILERLFYPDLMSIFMRLLVICILILYSAFTQSRRRRSKETKTDHTSLIGKTSIVWIGMGFGMAYWILESFRDVFIFQKGTLVKQMLAPDPMSFWIRLLAVCIIFLFSIYAQKLINERRKAVKALHESNVKLKELDRLKSEFLSTVSHELRTPISVVHESIVLSMEKKVGDLSTTQRKLLARALSNIDRLTRLINDLLDISRIEAGKMKIQKRIIDICTITRQVAEEYELEARNKNIAIETSLPSDTLTLYADGDKITQIFSNLISNAIRYTKTGGTISIVVKDADGFVECSVTDTGIGIAKENIPKLFSKFQQFGRVDGPGYRGTGLGLAISKVLVEKHEGKIWVKSQPNQGTTFSFTLKKAAFPKILVVDDEQSIIDVVRGFLEKEMYQVDDAHHGHEALIKINSQSYSLVILDMMMPQMSGYELIGRLKQDIRTQHLPFLIMSAYNIDETQLKEFGKNTAIPYINKPIEADKLKQKVSAILAEC